MIDQLDVGCKEDADVKDAIIIISNETVEYVRTLAFTFI
jgi:hypothetical protein